MKNAFSILTIFLMTLTAKADGILFSWGPKDLPGMTKERFEAAKNWTVEQIIEKNLSVDDWPEAYLLLLAANQHQQSIVPHLVNQLESNNEVKLKNTSRLIIWERIILGDIMFEGKGMQVDDDLFSVAGRANWILRYLTGKNYGLVKPNSTLEELKQLKSNWTLWKRGKKVDEYKTPYKSRDSGLNEINSIEALEAIIVSIKQTEEKTELTKNCLKRLYNLDELPTNKSSPANYCSPDTYSYMYLTTLTGIKDKHDYEWWSNWWIDNKDKLQWKKNKGQFKIK